MGNTITKIHHHRQPRIVSAAAPKPLWIPSDFIVYHNPLKSSSSSQAKRLNIIRAVSTSPGAESSAVSEGTVKSLDSVQVFDLDGNKVAISDLWKNRKAVVAFARHFGCVLCRKRADYLAAQKDKMDAAGVALVLIGPGSVDQAKTFAGQTKFKGGKFGKPLLCTMHVTTSTGI